MNGSKVPLHNRVENDLTYHEGPPGVRPEFYQYLREHAKILAHFIVEETPINREQSLALTHIEEAVQWAIASVVRYPEEAGK